MSKEIVELLYSDQNNGSNKGGYKQKMLFLEKTGWVGEVLRKNNMTTLKERRLLKKIPELRQSNIVQFDKLNKPVPRLSLEPLKNIRLEKPTTKKMSIVVQKFVQMLKTKFGLYPE